MFVPAIRGLPEVSNHGDEWRRPGDQVTCLALVCVESASFKPQIMKKISSKLLSFAREDDQRKDKKKLEFIWNYENLARIQIRRYVQIPWRMQISLRLWISVNIYLNRSTKYYSWCNQVLWSPQMVRKNTSRRWDLRLEVRSPIGGLTSNWRWHLRLGVGPPIGGEISNWRWDLRLEAPMWHVGISYSFEKKKEIILLLITSSRTRWNVNLLELYAYEDTTKIFRG